MTPTTASGTPSPPSCARAVPSPPTISTGLLENISVEIGAALMEEQARRKAAQARRGPSPNVLTLRPERASEAADPRPGAAEEH